MADRAGADAVTAARSVLADSPGVLLAAAFGSRIAGRPHKGSDLDIAVLMEAPADLSSLSTALERATGLTVDLIDMSMAPPLLRFEIARAGTPLLERAPWLWSDFRRRAMVDWWDWAPLARRMHRAAADRLRVDSARAAAHG